MHNQVFLSLIIVFVYRSDLGANLHFVAIAASVKPFAHCTFANLAQSTAEWGLHAIHTATLAADMFGKYGNAIHLRPEFGGLHAQILVIVPSGDIGVALYTVEPTIGNHFVHLFEILIQVTKLHTL